MRTFKIILLILVLPLMTLKGQTAAEIVANHLKAIGGADAWNALSSMKATGKSKWGSFEIPFVMITLKDGSTRQDVTLQGLKMVTAYDAPSKTGWMINPFQGSKKAEKMNDEQVQSQQESGGIGGELLCYIEKGWKIELLDKEDVDGVECFKIMLTKASGSVTYFFIDSQSWYLIKTTTRTKYEDREIESETQYSDFQTVSGVVVAMSIDNYADGKLQGQTLIEKVEFNLSFPAEDFKMPVGN
ncbi:MAG: hypothetical protein IT233_05860 [Bacteroidia bacterium]|nr:hypothetical protein [Bacteroidia bacterium]